MGCGESKHAVATAEPIKKSSTSRSSSRRMDKNLDRKDTVKTETTADNACSTPVENEIKKSNGVIATDATFVEKPVVEAATKTELGSGGDVKEEEKKTVVVVAHEQTMSKGSPGTDYYSEEAKSEYESPQHDVVFAAKEGGESKKDGNGVAAKEEKKMEGEKVRIKEGIKGGEMKDKKKMELGEGDIQEQMKTKGNTHGRKDQIPMTCEEKIPAKEKQGESANDEVVAVVGEAEKDERAVAITEKEKKKAKEQVVSKEGRTIEEQVAEENIKEAMRGITL